MRCQTEMLQLRKLILYSVLILFQIIHQLNCQIQNESDALNREREIENILGECAEAVRQEDYKEVATKLKLLNNYENDFNIIISRLYNFLGFDQMLKFANEIGNKDISTVIYQQIYKRIQNSSNDKLKIRLIKEVRQYIDKSSQDSYLNRTDVLKEQWKDTIKLYLYEFIITKSTKILSNHVVLISEIIQLDGMLLNRAFEDVFNEMIDLKGNFASINKDRIRDKYTAYFDAVKEIAENYEIQHMTRNSVLIHLAYQAKNKLSLLKEPPYAFCLPNNGSTLKQAFPTSITNLVFLDSVCITSQLNQRLKPSNTIIDGYKNLASVARDELIPWKIIQQNFTTYKIISEKGALFADDYFGEMGRRIYINPNFNKTYSDAMLWDFEYDKNGFILVKNKLYSEYLYVNDYNLTVFSLKSTNRGLWRTELCPREIQPLDIYNLEY